MITFQFQSFQVHLPRPVKKKKPKKVDLTCLARSVSLMLLSSEPEKLWLVLLQLVRWWHVWQDDNSVFMEGGDRGLFQQGDLL